MSPRCSGDDDNYGHPGEGRGSNISSIGANSFAHDAPSPSFPRKPESNLLPHQVKMGPRFRGDDDIDGHPGEGRFTASSRRPIPATWSTHSRSKPRSKARSPMVFPRRSTANAR